MKMYINGVLDTSKGVGQVLDSWSANDNWVFRAGPWGNPANSGMKVANMYMWNSALTSAQVASLVIPATGTPGVALTPSAIPGAAATSYYMPEPFGGSSYYGSW
jgi:hypothetical protein